MSSSLNQLLKQHSAKLRQERLKKNLSLICVLLLVPITLMAALDLWLIFSPALRYSAFVLVIAGWLWAAWLLLAKKPGKLETARQLDARIEQGSYAVTTALQLAELPQHSSQKPDQQQLENLQSYAHKSLSKVAYPKIKPDKYLLGGAALAAGGLAVLLAGDNQLCLQRILQPQAALDYTTIRIELPQVAPAAGEQFATKFEVQGARGEQLELSLYSADGSKILKGYPKLLPMSSDGKLSYEFQQGLYRDAVLQVSAGRGKYRQSEKIMLRSTPEIKNIQYLVRYPNYARHLNKTETTPSFTMLKGCEVELKLELSGNTSAANMLLDDRQKTVINLQSQPVAGLYNLQLPRIERSIDYRFQAKDPHGTYTLPEELQQIIVNEDKAPQIAITSNNLESLKAGDSKLKLAYNANDDIGLHRIELVFEVIGKAPIRQSRSVIKNATSSREELDVDFIALGAQPMDTVVVFLEAYDGNDISGPGKGASEPLMFEVPLPEKKDGEGKGGDEQSGKGEMTMHNPLDLQRGIYKDSLSKILGSTKYSWQDLALRQKQNTNHIGKMQEDRDMKGLGEEFLALLAEAEKISARCTQAMERSHPDEAKKLQAEVIAKLIEAARIQAAAPTPAEEEKKQEKKEDKQQNKSVKYSLIKNGSKKQKPKEQQEQEAMEKLAELQQLAQEQNKIADSLKKDVEKEMEEMRKRLSEQRKQAQSQAQSQQSQNQQAQNSPSQQSSQDGSGKSSPQPDSEASSEQQMQLAEKTADLLADLEMMRANNNSGIPQSALDDLKKAMEAQGKASGKMKEQRMRSQAHYDARDASSRINTSAEKIKAAMSASTGSMSNGSRPASGYEELINNYTRRLSYEQ